MHLRIALATNVHAGRSEVYEVLRTAERHGPFGPMTAISMTTTVDLVSRRHPWISTCRWSWFATNS